MNQEITFDVLSFSFVCKQILGTDNFGRYNNVRKATACISKHQFQVMLPLQFVYFRCFCNNQKIGIYPELTIMADIIMSKRPLQMHFQTPIPILQFLYFWCFCNNQKIGIYQDIYTMNQALLPWMDFLAFLYHLYNGASSILLRSLTGKKSWKMTPCREQEKSFTFDFLKKHACNGGAYLCRIILQMSKW